MVMRVAMRSERRTAIGGVLRRVEMIAVNCADQIPTAGLHEKKRNNQGDCATNQHKKILSLQSPCFKGMSQYATK